MAEPAFSRRTVWDTAESGLAAAIRQRRTHNQPVFDLTVSNPTACGFHFDSAGILSPLASPAALNYDPNPFGLLSAREAVVGYYAGHEAPVDPGRLLLTTSTSEAYSFLFRLLCDPGDAVLVAVPSYPLFDFLAGLDAVQLIPYPLFYDYGWWIDFAALEAAITPRTRALVLVHPNNPTGHATSAAERIRLEEICLQRSLALVVDEVFLDYNHVGPIASFAQGPHRCLTFVVSGISKVAALPQMKVGWIATFGPEASCGQALSRLEVIADTFLSMNAPAQHALPAWLAGSKAIQSEILDRVRTNVATLRQIGVEFLPVDAGWNAILRLPQRVAGSDPAERLVSDIGVITHPGSFYGIPGDHNLVVSLIGPTAPFVQGVELIASWVRDHNSL